MGWTPSRLGSLADVNSGPQLEPLRSVAQPRQVPAEIWIVLVDHGYSKVMGMVECAVRVAMRPPSSTWAPAGESDPERSPSCPAAQLGGVTGDRNALSRSGVPLAPSR